MLFVIAGVSSILYFAIVFVVAVILGSLLTALRNKLNGRFLNRYYVVSYKGNGIYELHFSPLFGFYYAKPSKYFELRSAAVSIFKSKYPEMSLFAITSTLQGYYRKTNVVGIPIQDNVKKPFLGEQLSYFMILRNLANYRKRPGTAEWQWLHLIQRVKQTPARKYWIIGSPE